MRCCSATQLGPSWRRWGGCAVFSESDGPEMGGCHEDATFVEAEAVCAAAGARMCTQEEIADGCTRGAPSALPRARELCD